MPTPHKRAQNSLLNTLLKRKLLSERLGPLALLEPLAQLEIQELLEFKAHRGQLQQLEQRVQRVQAHKAAQGLLAHKEQQDQEHKVALARQV
jgi:hypothetical protein